MNEQQSGRAYPSAEELMEVLSRYDTVIEIDADHVFTPEQVLRLMTTHAVLAGQPAHAAARAGSICSSWASNALGTAWRRPLRSFPESPRPAVGAF